MADYERREGRSRGREPPLYDGSTPFDQWKISFFSYVALENIRYIELTSAYPTDCDRYHNGASMTNEEMELRYDVDDMDEKDKVKKINTRLYFYLCSFTDGGARFIVTAVNDYHGLEAYRQLCARYDKTKQNDTISSMSKIMNMKITEADYEGHLITWEREITKYDKSTNSPMPDIVKVSLLINIIQGKLKDHLLVELSGGHDVSGRQIDHSELREVEGRVSTAAHAYGREPVQRVGADRRYQRKRQDLRQGQRQEG